MDDTKQKVNSCLEQSNSPEVFTFIRPVHSQSVCREIAKPGEFFPTPSPFKTRPPQQYSGKKWQNYGNSGGFEQLRYRNKLLSRSQLERKDNGQEKARKSSREGRTWALLITGETLRDEFAWRPRRWMRLVGCWWCQEAGSGEWGEREGRYLLSLNCV